MGCGNSTKKQTKLQPVNTQKLPSEIPIAAPITSITKNELKTGFTSKDAFITETSGDIHKHYDFGKVLGKGIYYSYRIIWRSDACYT